MVWQNLIHLFLGVSNRDHHLTKPYDQKGIELEFDQFNQGSG